MDAIALHQAGFAGAVAPLGTALTEQQLEELWRLARRCRCSASTATPPGARAAARAAELALPMLTAERSLRLAGLPAGEDPDTLVRNHGAPAFQAVLDAARPLAVALYDLVRETAGDSDAGAARGVARPAGGGGRQNPRPRIGHRIPAGVPRPVLCAGRDKRAAGDRRRQPAPRVAPAAGRAIAERGRNLLAIMLRHPALLHDVEEAFGGVELAARSRPPARR